MPFTNTYANQILDYTLSKTYQLTATERVYIGLCTNDPEADGGAIRELSGGGYSRVLISIRGETYPNVIGSASGRAITNPYQINWTKATLDWERINGFFLSTSGTVGETSGIFFYGALTLDEETKAAGGLLVEAGAVALFDPKSFKIEFPEKDIEVAE